MDVSQQIQLGGLDYIVFFGYFVLVIGIALWVSFKPRGHERTSEDFFLAGRALPWWIIGTSLIASNISAEQMIGMTGGAYAGGIAIVSYEWMAAVTLLIVARFFLPTFLKMQIYSMPQYLEQRFNTWVSMGLGIFWLLLYVFVNLATVTYLGALTLSTITGIPLLYGIIFLACVSAIYTLTGGLTAVAWTDFIQVTVLFVGGVAVTVIGLNAVSEQFALVDGGLIPAFAELMRQTPDKFHTVMPWNDLNLPWIGVFIGGMWAANLSYWGFNQYITQRALAGKNLREAQLGMAFAAFLKVIVPIVVVVPGIIAYVLIGEGLDPADKAYPTLISTYVPTGFKGLIIAALIAAIVSSLNSMTNSAATIFTMDIYRKINKSASERMLVLIGRISSGVALLIAASFAPFFGNFGQVFHVIQEYTGMISPGVVAVFILGVFWKRCTAAAALAMVLLTVPISVVLKFFSPLSLKYIPNMFENLNILFYVTEFMSPFLNQMGVAMILVFLVGYVVTLKTSKPGEVYKRDEAADVLTETSAAFYAASLLIMGSLLALYVYFY